MLNVLIGFRIIFVLAWLLCFPLFYLSCALKLLVLFRSSFVNLVQGQYWSLLAVALQHSQTHRILTVCFGWSLVEDFYSRQRLAL